MTTIFEFNLYILLLVLCYVSDLDCLSLSCYEFSGFSWTPKSSFSFHRGKYKGPSIPSWDFWALCFLRHRCSKSINPSHGAKENSGLDAMNICSYAMWLDKQAPFLPLSPLSSGDCSRNAWVAESPLEQGLYVLFLYSWPWMATKSLTTKGALFALVESAHLRDLEVN